MGGLSKLPNIGKTAEAQLAAVGVTTVDELRKVGSPIKKLSRPICRSRSSHASA